MRIGTGTIYSNILYDQKRIQTQLSDVLGQMSSGLQIKYGYQNTSAFNKTLSLDYNITILEQTKDIANNAFTYTNHTDSAIQELKKTMDTFKSKLVQAGNDIHSEASRLAIANELKGLRDHMLALANTSIGGEFLFGGTATTKAPFNPDGSYNGNNSSLNALINAHTSIAYNITGAELFFGSDRDTNRIISTNIPKYNQSALNPQIMDPNHPSGQGEKKFITAQDTIRDLVGDNDENTNNNDPEVFYITGRRPDGTTFKSKFELDVNYTDKKDSVKVQDLLDRIAKEFGNTEVSKVVDVSLNKWGQIEIKDLMGGRSNIEFHMISSAYRPITNNPPAQNGRDGVGVLDVNQLLNSGRKVNTYTQSPFLGTFSSSQITSVNDYNDSRIHTIPTTFRTHDNQVATQKTLLRDIFPSNVNNLNLSGMGANTATDTPGQAVNGNFTITDTSTLEDLMNSIKTTYGGNGANIDVQFSDGKIIVIDNNVSKKSPPDKEDLELPFRGPSSLRISIQTRQTTGTGADQATVINGFRNDYNVEYDKASFSKEGSRLTSNISQVVRSNNQYATPSTKLSEVAGGNLHGHSYTFEITDITGAPIKGEIKFDNAGSSVLINSPAQINGVNVANIPLPILNPNGNPPQVDNTLTPANEVTYQQLSDTLGMLFNLSNTSTADLQAVFVNGNGGQDNPPTNGADFNTPATKLAYENMISNAKAAMNIGINADGKLEIKDLNNAKTKMNLALYDNQSSDFTLNANGKVESSSHPSLTFQANAAIIADDAHVSFFAQLDVMIQSVQEGIYRPGETTTYNDSLRNPGIQNGLLLFDHLFEHVNKVHTKNGAQGSSFKDTIQRSEALILQVKTLRSETIDTDEAETALKLNTLALNYQALLSSVGKITQLSLVNYL